MWPSVSGRGRGKGGAGGCGGGDVVVGVGGAVVVVGGVDAFVEGRVDAVAARVEGGEVDGVDPHPAAHTAAAIETMNIADRCRLLIDPQPMMIGVPRVAKSHHQRVARRDAHAPVAGRVGWNVRVLVQGVAAGEVAGVRHPHLERHRPRHLLLAEIVYVPVGVTWPGAAVETWIARSTWPSPTSSRTCRARCSSMWRVVVDHARGAEAPEAERASGPGHAVAGEALPALEGDDGLLGAVVDCPSRVPGREVPKSGQSPLERDHLRPTHAGRQYGDHGLVGGQRQERLG